MELCEYERLILIIVSGYGDWVRSYDKESILFNLFNDTFPDLIAKSTLYWRVWRFEECGIIKNCGYSGWAKSSLREDVKLDVILKVIENSPHLIWVIRRHLDINESPVDEVLI